MKRSINRSLFLLLAFAVAFAAPAAALASGNAANGAAIAVDPADAAGVALKKDFDQKYERYVSLLGSNADERTLKDAEEAAAGASKKLEEHLGIKGGDSPAPVSEQAVQPAAEAPGQEKPEVIEIPGIDQMRARYEKALKEYKAIEKNPGAQKGRAAAEKELLLATAAMEQALSGAIRPGAAGDALIAELVKISNEPAVMAVKRACVKARNEGLRTMAQSKLPVNAGSSSPEAKKAQAPPVEKEKKSWFASALGSIGGFFADSYDAIFSNKHEVRPDRPAKDPKREILVIGHAGAPQKEPDNTIEGFERAVADGANVIETDIGITADGHVVHLHDWDPDSLISKVRQAGLQGFRYRPWCPAVTNKMRKPVYQLTLDELRANYGYTLSRDFVTGRAKRSAHRIPAIDEFAAWLAAKGAAVRFVYLDVKIPPESAGLVEPMVVAIAAAAAKHGVLDKLVFFSPHAAIAAKAKAVAAERKIALRIGLDMELPAKPLMSLDTKNFEVVRLAGSAGYQFASVGRPTKVTVAGGWKSYMNIVNKNLNLQARSYKKVRLLCWTINDPEEIRELLKAGVDGVMTDDPALVAAELAR